MRIEAAAIAELDRFLAVAETSARPAAALAMNDITGGKGAKHYRLSMREQIAFPPGYLEDTERFGQTGYATPSRLETKITARSRPTSLARFASGMIPGAEGMSVTVKTGRTTRLRRAFSVRLRAGTVLDAANFNVGIAVRVQPGQTIRNKRDLSGAARLAPNVFLLYAPSVDQVFRNVAETATPKVLEMMGGEFIRQFTRLTS
jgi:hypothetical protein